MDNRPKKRVKLGEMLLEQSAISPDQLEQALKEQKRTGRKLGRVLTDLGMLSEDDLHQALARHLQLPYVDLRQMTLDPVTVRKLPEAHARRFRALVLQEDKRGLLVGMADPSDLLAYDELSKRLKQTLRIAVVSEGELLRMLDVVYRRTDEIASLVQEVRDDLRESDVDLEQLTADDGSADAPVLRLLQSMFTDAVQVGASDIHIEPGEARLRIRQRIDGVLQEQVLEGNRVAGALVTRLKLMSGLDISEKRLPQDGRFSIKVGDAQLDVRVATMPSQHGEAVVLRLLNQAVGLQPLEMLGMPEDLERRFRKLIQRNAGMVLVTGPTGSGKTTTLYSALNILNKPDAKIITVEDPSSTGSTASPRCRPRRKSAWTSVGYCVRRCVTIRTSSHRRNARSGNRRHRLARGDHGPPRVLDAAHDERGRDHRSARRHGGGGLHGGRRRACGARTAPRAAHLRRLRRTLYAR